MSGSSRRAAGSSVSKGHRLNADFLHAIGASVACARILGLDAERHCHAMALSICQANGLCALFHERRHISKAYTATADTPPPASQPP